MVNCNKIYENEITWSYLGKDDSLAKINKFELNEVKINIISAWKIILYQKISK